MLPAISEYLRQHARLLNSGAFSLWGSFSILLLYLAVKTVNQTLIIIELCFGQLQVIIEIQYIVLYRVKYLMIC